MVRARLVSLFCLFSFQVFFSQEARFTGMVIDKTTIQGIPMVHVYVQGTSIGTSTDSVGRFSLRVEKNSSQVVVFSHIAYHKEFFLIRLEDRNAFDTTVLLNPRTITSEGVTVTATRPFEEGMATRILNRKEIEKRAPQRVDDLIRWYAPARMKLTAGRRNYLVFWNGIRVNDDVDLDFIDPQTVEKVLIWRMNNAPLQYTAPAFGSPRALGTPPMAFVVEIRTTK